MPGQAILTAARPGWSQEAALAEQLLREKRQGAKSFYEPYISVLAEFEAIVCYGQPVEASCPLSCRPLIRCFGLCSASASSCAAVCMASRWPRTC